MPSGRRSFYDTYARDLRAEDVERLFTRDARDAYEKATLLADERWKTYAAKVQPLVLQQEKKILVPAALLGLGMGAVLNTTPRAVGRN